MFGEVEYDYDRRCQCSRYSYAMFRTKEESHQTEERGPNQPTGLVNGERALSDLNFLFKRLLNFLLFFANFCQFL